MTPAEYALQLAERDGPLSERQLDAAARIVATVEPQISDLPKAG